MNIKSIFPKEQVEWQMKEKFFWSGKNGPLMIAEIGGNHEGSFSFCKKTNK